MVALNLRKKLNIENEPICLTLRVPSFIMLVMIRWLMNVKTTTMFPEWSSVEDKFSLGLDLKERLGKH
jgi:hypothetical protein